LLCDLASGVNGVLGARWSGAQRVAIICKKEVLQLLFDRLTSGYYTPRNLPAGLATQVFPCRGAGIVDI
jgi:hypothetical protein